MRKTRVCIYGGTDVGSWASFVEALAYEVLDSMGAVIVTGGFSHGDDQDAKSTDSAALDGARRYAEEKGKELRECFEAWVPEPRLDERPDAEGVVRMNDDLGIRVRIMEGLTALGRRLTMVASVDLVVTVAGLRHTEVVAEQALELGIPVLPISATGGDSKKIFDAYPDRIVKRFDARRVDECFEKVTSDRLTSDPLGAAKDVVRVLQTARFRKCLILLPYDDEHERVYERTVRHAVEEHMLPLRLDEEPWSEQIHENFEEALRDAVAVIADVTLPNESVTFELGYALARGIRPLIYMRRWEEERFAGLPVYVRSRNVRKAEGEALKKLIGEYLDKIKVELRTQPVPDNR